MSKKDVKTIAGDNYFELIFGRKWKLFGLIFWAEMEIIWVEFLEEMEII